MEDTKVFVIPTCGDDNIQSFCGDRFSKFKE
jgi:hypothetical protein